MRRDYFKHNWQVLLLNFIVILCFILFYGKFGSIFVDSFREAYIPEQILNGEILYKNIFCIYAPFAYLFNAFLFKIFGINLNILYFLGLISSLLIVNLAYIIGRKFLPQLYTFAALLFTISVLIISPTLFNTIFPYSFGMVYGLIFALFSIYFALNKKFPLSYLMYSFAIASKYEFLLLLPALIFISRKNDIFKNLISLIIPQILVFLPLFFMGLGFSDLTNELELLADISSTKTMHYYYYISGLIFSPKLLLFYTANFIKILLPIILLVKFRNVYTIFLTFLYLYIFIKPEIFIYLIPLILILLIIKFKKLSLNKRFFCLSSILVSAKMFFAYVIKSYGVYYTPLLLISLFILLSRSVKKSLLVILLLSTFIFASQNVSELLDKNYKISTNRGTVFVTSDMGDSISKLNKYILSDTLKGDKVLLLPEMTSVNFLTNRGCDNKLYSLIPMYVEAFSEDAIISRLKNKKIEYIIITNFDSSDYYYSFFGKDYGVNITKYIKDNYDEINEFIGDSLFKVYKLR